MARGKPSTPEENAAAKALYLDHDNELSLLDIATSFGRSLGWLQGLMKRGKWPERPALHKRSKPHQAKPPRVRPERKPALPAPVSAPPISKLDYRLYGDRADDVAFLKGIGCTVAPFKGDQIRVDSEVLDPEQFAAKVATERKRRQPGLAATAVKATPAAPMPVAGPNPSTPAQPRAATSAPWRRTDPSSPSVAVSLTEPTQAIEQRVATMTDAQRIEHLEGVVVNLGGIIRIIVGARRITGSVQRRLLEDLDRVAGPLAARSLNQTAPTGSRQPTR